MAFFEEFVLLYPVYALLFADHGLSAGQISTLFVIWSLTSFLLEIPSGAWADAFSRRRLLVLSPLLTAAGFGLWTFLPGYWSFVAGFVLWGVATAISSGTSEALVYEELARLDASGAYPRITGRAEAVGTTAMMIASAVAGPAMAFGGYQAVGVASMATLVAAALIARTLPETREQPEEADGYLDVLRAGFREVSRSKTLLRRLALVSAVTGLSAFDEYLPLLAQGTGVGDEAVPPLMVLVSAGFAIGGFLAGRGLRWAGPITCAGGLALIAGAAVRSPWGFVLVAAAFGAIQWAIAAADARLQDGLSDRSRATVTSMSGLGTEVMAVLTFAFYGLGSELAPSWVLFAALAAPYTIIGAFQGRSAEKST
ncbi:MFS transporter [Herbidospora cretacea]|uniref:MFS transporter n=1 Tax=Herbidospora cretacea TaxID=28444 RepID=UPI0007737097|nr:MFS transporter [Herbidospora cretacea]